MDKQDRNLQKKAPWLIAVIVAVLVLVASAVGWYWLSDDQIVELGGTTYKAEVVDSPRARAKGLSGRSLWMRIGRCCLSLAIVIFIVFG